MTKHNLIHTLDAPDYKAHIPFLRKLKDYKCTLWSEKYSISKFCCICWNKASVIILIFLERRTKKISQKQGFDEFSCGKAITSLPFQVTFLAKKIHFLCS